VLTFDKYPKSLLDSNLDIHLTNIARISLDYFTHGSRVSSKQTKINFGSNRNKPKQDLFRVCFGLFRETKNQKVSVCFGVSNLYRNKRTKQNCFVTNRN
jgi:hypothetical protein